MKVSAATISRCLARAGLVTPSRPSAPAFTLTDLRECTEENGLRSFHSWKTCLMSLPDAFSIHAPGVRVTSEASRAQAGVEDGAGAAGACSPSQRDAGGARCCRPGRCLAHPCACAAPTGRAGLTDPVGIVVTAGIDLIRAAGTATRSRRELSVHSRYLTVSTWTGLRTIDLRGLKRVRAQRIVSRTSKATYLTVTDIAGVHVVFRAPRDIKAIGRALEPGMRQQSAKPVKVSRLARGVLGIQPLPGWMSALWTLGSTGLSVFIMLGCLVTVSSPCQESVGHVLTELSIGVSWARGSRGVHMASVSN